MCQKVTPVCLQIIRDGSKPQCTLLSTFCTCVWPQNLHWQWSDWPLKLIFYVNWTTNEVNANMWNDSYMKNVLCDCKMKKSVIYILKMKSWINMILSPFAFGNITNLDSVTPFATKSTLLPVYNKRFNDLRWLKKWQSLFQWTHLSGENEGHRAQQRLHNIRFKYSTGCASRDALVITWCSDTNSTVELFIFDIHTLHSFLHFLLRRFLLHQL